MKLEIPADRVERLVQLDALRARLLDGAGPGPGLLEWQGLRLRYTDPTVLYYQIEQIFYARTYWFETDSPDPRVIDCGGNIGLSTIYFKWRYPLSRITVFEPDPALAEILAENLHANRIEGVELVPAAVAGHAGSVAFHPDGRDAGRIGPHGAAGAERPIEVPAVRLSDYLQEPVDQLKLDVEGAELEILEECEDRLAAVARLVLEYHGWSNEPQRLHRILALLDRRGFRYCPHQVQYHLGRPPDRLAGAVYMLAIYAIPDTTARC